MKNLVKWYEKGWVIALCFISLIFIPVGLFLMWKFKKWHNFWKISLSVIFGFLFLITVFSGFSNSSSNSNQESTASQSTSENSNEEKSDTSESTEEESKKSDQQSQTEETKEKEKSETATTPETSSDNTSSTQSQSASSSGTSTKSSSSSTSNSKSSSSGSTRKPNAELSESRTVYITPTGKKYHYANPCGKGTYKPIKLDDAIKRGYGPCEKCVLH